MRVNGKYRLLRKVPRRNKRRRKDLGEVVVSVVAVVVLVCMVPPDI